MVRLSRAWQISPYLCDGVGSNVIGGTWGARGYSRYSVYEISIAELLSLDDFHLKEVSNRISKLNLEKRNFAF